MLSRNLERLHCAKQHARSASNMPDLPKKTVRSPFEGNCHLPKASLESDKVVAERNDPGSDGSGMHVRERVIAVFACLYVVLVGWLAVRSLGHLSFSKGILPYLIVLAGFLAYYARQKLRFTYGIIEVLFGVCLCMIDLSNTPTLRVEDLGAVLASVPLAKEVAGFYVVVRGLDNIGKAIKQYPSAIPGQIKQHLQARLKIKWEKLFGFE